MKKIELIYDKDCPNVEEARRNIRAALSQTGLPKSWREWDRNAPSSPAHARTFGSPTVLVEGKDVAGMSEAEGNNCRVYQGDRGRIQGVPPVDQIVSALEKRGRGNWKSVSGIFPVIGAGLLPKLTCPACWPAYSWLLGVLGLKFVNYTPWLFPITAGFLVLSLSVLLFRAEQRRGYGPFFLGIAGAGLLLAGKFQFNISLVTNTGILVLMIGFLWNVWPRRKEGKTSCPACLEPERQS